MNKNDSVPNEEEVETFFIRPQKKFFVVLLKKKTHSKIHSVLKRVATIQDL